MIKGVIYLSVFLLSLLFSSPSLYILLSALFYLPSIALSYQIHFSSLCHVISPNSCIFPVILHNLKFMHASLLLLRLYSSSFLPFFSAFHLLFSSSSSHLGHSLLLISTHSFLHLMQTHLAILFPLIPLFFLVFVFNLAIILPSTLRLLFYSLFPSSHFTLVNRLLAPGLLVNYQSLLPYIPL